MSTVQTAIRTHQTINLRQEIVGIDRHVPLLDGTTRPYVYLDNAASTPAFRGVQQTVDEFLAWYSSVHRGSGFKSLLSTRSYDQAREIVADFVGADLQTETVIFGKNATEAINKLANRITWQPGDVVLTTRMEHHSNDLPWRAKAQVEHVGTRVDGTLNVDDLRHRLVHHRNRVKLVAVTGASNVSGFVPPLHEIAAMAHEHGALILADCAQLAPHRAIDMKPFGSPEHLDFAAISAHKMYAPYGAGALIGPRSFFEQGDPDYRGGGTVEIVGLDEVYWAGPPARDEAGSPNVVGAVALAASMRILSQAGMDALAQHEKALTRYALRQLNQVAGVRIYGSSDPERLEDRLGVIALQVEGVPHGKVAAILGFEGGIGVRNGCFCAHPYVIELLGTTADAYRTYKAQVLNHDRSQLPGLVRLSFGCYNTLEEIDLVVEMLARIVRGDYQGDYVQDRATGDFVPRNYDPSVLDNYFSLGMTNTPSL